LNCKVNVALLPLRAADGIAQTRAGTRARAGRILRAWFMRLTSGGAD
jgi:hypothetical protein